MVKDEESHCYGTENSSGVQNKRLMGKTCQAYTVVQKILPEFKIKDSWEKLVQNIPPDP